jgi:hypothetical protein
MGAPLEPRILRRAAALFATLLAAIALSVALLAWHHTRTAPHCPDPAQADGPVSCHVQAWHFGPSRAALAAMLLLLSGLCMLVAWAWSFARRR